MRVALGEARATAGLVLLVFSSLPSQEGYAVYAPDQICIKGRRPLNTAFPNNSNRTVAAPVTF